MNTLQVKSPCIKRFCCLRKVCLSLSPICLSVSSASLSFHVSLCLIIIRSCFLSVFALECFLSLFQVVWSSLYICSYMSCYLSLCSFVRLASLCTLGPVCNVRIYVEFAFCSLWLSYASQRNSSVWDELSFVWPYPQICLAWGNLSRAVAPIKYSAVLYEPALCARNVFVLFFLFTVQGNDDNRFAVDRRTCDVYLVAPLDYVRKPSYNVTLTAYNLVNGNKEIGDTQILTINVIHVDRYPPVWRFIYYLSCSTHVMFCTVSDFHSYVKLTSLFYSFIIGRLLNIPLTVSDFESYVKC